jgi:hypothetical protein
VHGQRGETTSKEVKKENGQVLFKHTFSGL